MKTGGDLYTDMEMINLSNMPKWYRRQKIAKMSISEACRWSNRLQRSLMQFSKRHKEMLEVQMAIVCLTLDIKRICWQPIMDDYKIKIKQKYPIKSMNPVWLKSQAKGKTEIFFKKICY